MSTNKPLLKQDKKILKIKVSHETYKFLQPSFQLKHILLRHVTTVWKANRNIYLSVQQREIIFVKASKEAFGGGVRPCKSSNNSCAMVTRSNRYSVICIQHYHKWEIEKDSSHHFTHTVVLQTVNLGKLGQLTSRDYSNILIQKDWYV